MDGLCFEVKEKYDSSQELSSSWTHHQMKEPVPDHDSPQEETEEVRYRLYLIGSLPVHPLSTMAMLPWIVAEIRKPKDCGNSGATNGNTFSSTLRNKPVSLLVSASSVRCLLDTDPGRPWDPLHHTLVFQHQPHHVHKLIHNSQEPSYFGCLIRDQCSSTAYAFCCEDHQKVRAERGG